MTGFASGERVIGEARIAWRIKSVNHRFLDLSMRLPEGCEALEIEAGRRLKQRFARGHLECVFTVGVDPGATRRMELDETLLMALLDLERRMGNLASCPAGTARAPLSLDRLLSWPGMTSERRLAAELLDAAGQATILELLESVCDDLDRARAEEGRALVEVLRRLIEALHGRIAEVKGAMPGARAVVERKLRERVTEFMGGTREGMDEGLARELAYLLNRMEIAEEVERLGVHLREMDSLLSGDQPVGLRLDFLCQELNREGNTLCSKAQDHAVSKLGVEIKVLVEQLREQARNLE
ncbi:MAG: YicC family protein [Magnetococcales bacterium]|nr:YicC family protein [Magnetococcales bacterium]